MERVSITECPDEQQPPSGPRVIAVNQIPLGAGELVPLGSVTGLAMGRSLVGGESVCACGRGRFRLRPLGLSDRRGGQRH